MPPTGEQIDVVVIGAGPAGLAVGACLRRAGVGFLILEREATVGASWRRHYDRLHLHTDRAHSSLPYLPLPRDYPRYPSRDQVVAYLEAYARAFELAPRCGEEVTRARARDGGWEVETARARYRAQAVVVATGACAVPVRPRWPGLDAYRGPVLHSAEYRNGERFRGTRVLVVGVGNSGGEIAIDLVEHGARPTLAARGPVNLLPRELLGLPILTWAIALSRLPPAVGDALARPLLRLALGDPARYGLRRPERGPMQQIRERGRIPLIDVGTLALVRAGRIAVRPGVARFTPEGAAFEGGAEEAFDAVVLATGYAHGLERFIDGAERILGPEGRPAASGRETALPGLFLCGFRVAPTGMLREIAREARRIADALALRVGSRGRRQSRSLALKIFSRGDGRSPRGGHAIGHGIGGAVMRSPEGRESSLLQHGNVSTRIPAHNLERARAFYAEKLGIEPAEERPGGLLYRCGSGSFALFESAGAASGNHTQMAWEVADIEATVAALRARGVVFEEYDLPGLRTVGGIATITGNYPSKGGVGEKGAWFRDSEGNLLAIGQPVR